MPEHLEWEGCFNVRDLGGLSTSAGRKTRRAAVVRADALGGLSDAGWAALIGHGVRTVIDLRNEDERAHVDASQRPASVTTVPIPLDVSEDREFWNAWESGPQFGTPLYYRPHLERFPARNAAVVAAIADAQPGGVAFHCGSPYETVPAIANRPMQDSSGRLCPMRRAGRSRRGPPWSA